MKNFFAILFLIIVGAALYAVTARGVLGNATGPTEFYQLNSVGQVFESSHERSPWAMMQAMIQNNTVELTKELADFASPDVAYINQKFYSFFPPGVPVLMMPFYHWGSAHGLGLVAAYATMPLVSIGSLILLYLVARQVFRLPIWASLLAPLLFAFASTSWSYAVTIYQHAPVTFLLLLAFYAAWRFKVSGQATGWLWAIVSGTAYGISVFVDYPGALLLAPAIIYLIANAISVSKDESKYRFSVRFSVVLGLAAVALLATVHMYYNAKTFGSPLQFHNPAPRYTTERYEELLNSQVGNGQTKPGAAIQVFEEVALAKGGYELLVAPDKGLFFFSAAFILALIGLLPLYRRINMETGFLIGFILLNFFMYASFHDPWGGWAFGPRYLIPAMAMLSIPAAASLALLRKWWLHLIALLLVAYSSGVALLGVLTTSLIPPKVEADYLGLKYNFLRNWDFLQENTSGSFIYNTYFHDRISLLEYGLVIYGFLLLIFLVIIFVLPLFGRKKESKNHPQIADG